ncbi:MAG: peptidoglycan-binding protein [Clostridia bacterium]|nr:peptidoglycan-binding protein [Clostridia bacterium]
MRDITSEPAIIYEIQRYLYALHFDTDGEIPLVNPDGIYGPETSAAVSAFQRMAELPVTGQVDFETWRRLYAAYIDSVERSARPSAIFPFPEEAGYTIRRGEYSDIAALVQFVLRLLSNVYDELEGLPPSGIYDDATMEDIRVFQRAHNLPQTGEVDRRTWNALASDYNRFNHPLQ